ncbi:DUF1852 domain-containing protein [Pseudomonas putida]|uniref:DUF1852 domain-containing protein n=1 Tax=Pseudomonas putida TaxID=303 RepID=UPI0018AAE4DB|nr:DUF1852 domain-containing protein [Pseudomonas putida]MBF8651946.1 DUF1852 domain-containing protein [Pseudomonas putida]MBF8655898.1 DUF1852 domain-containing protein [Pseudomonas putida]
MTPQNITYSLKRTRFDEHYCPCQNTRLTTNFANLARGSRREQNLRQTLDMINNRFNALAHWDNPAGDRYTVELDIVSVHMHFTAGGTNTLLPLIEILSTTVIDHHAGKRLPGVVGNNFSSYVRDYDFSIVLPAYNAHRPNFSAPADFGALHGKLFKGFVGSTVYQQTFIKPPVICLSVSSSRTYERTGHYHPVLGYEYRQDEYSLTDAYFQKMGLRVRYFMPAGNRAPLALYFSGDLLNDYTPLELISSLSTMETFQKIYRPEIYNANATAGATYQPSLQHEDYSLTRIVYDREERSRLAIEQGKFAEAHFIKPYHMLLEQWSAHFAD